MPFCLVLVFPSCLMQYGNTVTQNFTKISNDSCDNRPGSIFLFYEGEKTDFLFKRVGLIEVIGAEGTTDEELLNRLKYQAYLNCANAIINVQLLSMSRETGFVSDPKTKRSYLAKRYSGLAIRMPDIEYSSGKYGSSTNTAYLPAIEGYNKKSADEFVFKLVFGTVLVIGLIVYAVTKR